MYDITLAIPDPGMLLDLEPEELAAKLLYLLRRRTDLGGRFHPDNLESELWQKGPGRSPYPIRRQADIAVALAEAYSWLQVQGLIVPDSGANGTHGWRRLNRRAQRIENEADFTQYVLARRLPREALHTRLATTVWLAFMRGEFDVAVFQATKAVEVAVRETGKLPDSLLGVKLMRAAFAPVPNPGTLTDTSVDAGEQVARMELFAGTIGSYKNPLSHHDIQLKDPAEAIEIVMLANHLLRIVDSRKTVLP